MTKNAWEELWRELASRDIQADADGEAQMVERWRRVAGQLDAEGKRQGYPDPLLDYILSRIESGMTVLDIGAGIGRWTIPIAQKVRSVTAIEPLAGMREVLLERIASLRVDNVTVVESAWQDSEVPAHDVAIASHSTYVTTDLVAFAKKMDSHARRTCYLALRLPAHDGIIGELSQRIWGRWHDSPNFIVGYNLLLSAGFYANALVEPKPVRFWKDPTLDDAMARARRHLHLTNSAHDALIREILTQRLALREGAYHWPDAMRSALVWWDKP